MAPMFGFAEPFGLAPRVAVSSSLLGTPVVLWGGWPFFHKFWLSLKNRSPNMYTLIGLGVGSRLRLQRRRGVRAGPLPARFRDARRRESAPISRRRR